MEMEKERKELIEGIEYKIVRAKDQLSQCIKGVDSNAMDGYFDLFASLSCHEKAARVKVDSIILVILKSDRTFEQARGAILQRVLDNSTSTLNSTSPTLNVMKALESNEWARAYSDYFGSYE